MNKLTILGVAMSLMLVACGNQADDRDQMTDDSFEGVTEESVLITVPEDMTQPSDEPQPMPEQPSQPEQPSMNHESMNRQDQSSFYADEVASSVVDPAMEEALSSLDLFIEKDNTAN